MRKLILLFVLISTLLVGCKKEDDETSYPSIVGSWSDITITDGEYISGKLELRWTFNNNHTGDTRLIMTVNDKVMRDFSSPFNYDYKGSYIIIRTEDETLNYSISISGNKMRLGNEEKGYFNLTKK